MLQPISSKKVEENPQTKKRSQSQRRLMKLQKIGFEIEAQKLRKEYSNKNILNEMKMKSKSTKKILTEITPEKIGNFLKPTKIISATAHKWVIYDFYSSKYIRGYRARDSHELNVFSKLLVFCAVNTIVEKFKLDMSRFETIVTEGVLKLHKGNCDLKTDDILSLQDLLALMIIEESQVYETILAINIGAFLQRKRKKEYYSVFDAHDKHMKEHLKQFYDLVNSYCKLLKLENIRYVESQPEFRKEKNKCSASDVAILSIECLKIPLFMQVLKKITHQVKIKFINADGQLKQRHFAIQNKAILNKYIPYSSVCRNWEQNNFMNSHCSIYYENQSSQLRPIVVVLLGCYGPHDREKDIQQIAEWYLKSGNVQSQPINESKQQLAKEESMQESIVRNKSSQKLAPLKTQGKSISNELQTKINHKLKTEAQKQVTNRYDDAIKFKNPSKSIRMKTQL